MKKNKAPGRWITEEIVKNGGKVTMIVLNKILKEKKIPNNWYEAVMILLI